MFSQRPVCFAKILSQAMVDLPANNSWHDAELRPRLRGLAPQALRCRVLPRRGRC
jgi:hypothetical protein